MALSDLQIKAADATYDFIAALEEHITARVRYDRDGPRHAGENPPEQGEISLAFVRAVSEIVKANAET